MTEETKFGWKHVGFIFACVMIMVICVSLLSMYVAEKAAKKEFIEALESKRHEAVFASPPRDSDPEVLDRVRTLELKTEAYEKGLMALKSRYEQTDRLSERLEASIAVRRFLEDRVEKLEKGSKP